MLEIAKSILLDTYSSRSLLFKNWLKHHDYCFDSSHSTSPRSFKVSFLPFNVYSKVIESSLIISWPLSSRRFFERVEADQGMKIQLFGKYDVIKGHIVIKGSRRGKETDHLHFGIPCVF